MMKVLSVICLFTSLALAQKVKEKTIEVEQPNFESIKKYLKKDFLEESAKKVTKKVEQKIEKSKKVVNAQYHIPGEKEFWRFFSELWLVNNAQMLKWDFQKPDYGLDITFKEVMERLGFYHYKFKILVLDTYNITHLGLRAGENEYILLLSLPFIRTMDLTKREISMLLFEDMLRVDAGYLLKRIKNAKLEKMLGTNFENKDFNMKSVKQALTTLTHFILKEGFSFQEQFELTSKMEKYLSNYSDYKAAYVKLLRKVDFLVKKNKLFSAQNRLYPSAEMQLKWLTPSKKSNRI